MRASARLPSPDEPWHGSLSGYNRHACRCPDCREASRTYNALRREQDRQAKLAASVTPDPVPMEYTRPHPVWRCSYDNHWQERELAEAVPDCPVCEMPMFATTRTPPTPSPAIGSPFEDL